MASSGMERTMAAEHAGREVRRGRHPLPTEDRGETISCYLPRWAILQLGECAEGVHLSRNKLVRQILIEYLADAKRSRLADGAGTPLARGER